MVAVALLALLLVSPSSPSACSPARQPRAALRRARRGRGRPRHRAARAPALSRRPRRPPGRAAATTTLLLARLDGFAAYDAAFGHRAGDALLVRLADELRRAVRDEAVAYRPGGTTFCALTGDDVLSIDALERRVSPRPCASRATASRSPPRSGA